MKKMKIILALVLAIVMVGAFPVSAAEAAAKEEGDFPQYVVIELDLESLWSYVDLDRGYDLRAYLPGGQEEFQLNATVYPLTADQTVTWSSSNPNIPVDENGVITTSNGLFQEAVIYAKAANGATGAFTVFVDTTER